MSDLEENLLISGFISGFETKQNLTKKEILLDIGLLHFLEKHLIMLKNSNNPKTNTIENAFGKTIDKLLNEISEQKKGEKNKINNYKNLT